MPTKLLADAALPVEDEADGEEEGEGDVEADLFSDVFPLELPDLLHPTNDRRNIRANPKLA